MTYGIFPDEDKREGPTWGEVAYSFCYSEMLGFGWTYEDFMTTPVAFLVAMANKGEIPEPRLGPRHGSFEAAIKWGARRKARLKRATSRSIRRAKDHRARAAQ